MTCYPYDPIEQIMLFIDDNHLCNQSKSTVRRALLDTGLNLVIFNRIKQNPVLTLPYNRYISQSLDAVKLYRGEMNGDWQWADAVAFAHSASFAFDGMDYETELYPEIKANASLFEQLRSGGVDGCFAWNHSQSSLP